MTDPRTAPNPEVCGPAQEASIGAKDGVAGSVSTDFVGPSKSTKENML